MQKAKNSRKKMEMYGVGSKPLYCGRPYMSVSTENIRVNQLPFSLMGGLSSSFASDLYQSASIASNAVARRSSSSIGAKPSKRVT